MVLLLCSTQPAEGPTYNIANVCSHTRWPLLSLLLDSTFAKPLAPGRHTVYCQADTIKAVVEYNSQGQRNGEWSFYYPNGNVICSLIFTDDTHISNYNDYYRNSALRIHIPNGTLTLCEHETQQYLINPCEKTTAYTIKCEPYYSINGTWHTYDAATGYQYVNTIYNGIDNGPFAVYDSTGKKFMECNCKNGEQVDK